MFVELPVQGVQGFEHTLWVATKYVVCFEDAANANPVVTVKGKRTSLWLDDPSETRYTVLLPVAEVARRLGAGAPAEVWR